MQESRSQNLAHNNLNDKLSSHCESSQYRKHKQRKLQSKPSEVIQLRDEAVEVLSDNARIHEPWRQRKIHLHSEMKTKRVRTGHWTAEVNTQ